MENQGHGATWIADGEKYALIGLDVRFEGASLPEKLAPGLRVFTKTRLYVPTEWEAWLGSIRTEEISSINLYFVRTIPSATPSELDGENKSLLESLKYLYIGLLLSAMFSPYRKPIMLTGARLKGVIDIRQQKDLEIPAPQIFRLYPAVVADDVVSAANLGQQLDTMLQNRAPGELWRFVRTLSIYVNTRPITDIVDRIHQYCRCIEGLILPTIGKTKRHFKSRTELFIGPKHHELMGELYDIRSNAEHLHKNDYTDISQHCFWFDLLRKEAIVEYIARMALARIIARDTLWPYFRNTKALGKFWERSPDEQRDIWGKSIDPMVSVAESDPENMNGRIRWETPPLKNSINMRGLS